MSRPTDAGPGPAGPDTDVDTDVDGDGVLEHAVLDVTPGREAEFELAFAEARRHLASAPGFRWLRLARGVERPSRYLLLVGWASLEDHTGGFRGSPAYEEWRRLLHHFYDPFPTVEHFTEAARA